MLDLAVEPQEKVLLMERVFDAPPELVFRTWIDCEHIKRWWGPEGFTAPECSIDFRVGGKWRINIRSNDGQEFWHGGTYTDIVDNEKIVFTHSWEYTDKPGHETTVTVLFEELDGKTKFTFHQAFMIDAVDRDNHKQGWTGCFDHLEEYIKILT